MQCEEKGGAIKEQKFNVANWFKQPNSGQIDSMLGSLALQHCFDHAFDDDATKAVLRCTKNKGKEQILRLSRNHAQVNVTTCDNQLLPSIDRARP